ncbi:Gfo/Idh/MocA family oxidoreductase [Terribacillus sp. 179-K 1B1 HS]|uniref:Gfo/Idh/MocA family protein n=1 Tax=Terribacillus sp. 179-K 1B1 HS TaxID=3142388 RepID=UPI0039A33031
MALLNQLEELAQRAAEAAANREIVPFTFSVAGLDHPHIYGMVQGLLDAGAQLVHIYDRNPDQAHALSAEFQTGKVVAELSEILHSGVDLVATSIVPSARGALGVQVLEHDKHFLSAKAPFTTMAQLHAAEDAVRRSGKKWAVFYSERLAVEAALLADEIVQEGLIGELFQLTGSGPHRLQAQTRPAWFFDPGKNGGILCDIGSHQIEQLLHYARCNEAKVLHSKVANYAHPQYGDWQDFGDATLVTNTGVSQYFRVDWFTPKGLRVWGDGRTVLHGTNGFVELRKYTDVARSAEGDHLYVVTDHEEVYFPAKGKVGIPYFGQLIDDCMLGTETAMRQEHTFQAAALAIQAQEQAISLTKAGERR